MMQANESINNIYDEALANWHALNERMKNQDLSGIEPWPLVCRTRILPQPNRITAVSRQI